MIHPATDLNFAGQKCAYATHAMHSFSAKFPPQLPRWAIQEFTKKGDAVFDPFVCSGTTFVEAKLLGRNSYGAEIDPLSRLIAKVKSTPIDTLILHRYTQEAAIIISEWFAKWREKRGKRKGLGTLGLNLVIPDFPNRDY